MKSLGKYEILEVLGSGSMGTVYRAHDTVIDRDIALKTIRTGNETEPEMRERFYREARSCGRLQHPNIVTIYDLGEEASTAFIAMELLDGLDFRKLMDEGRDIPVARKLEWMAQVCDALGHAHQHGVIHRDVKPSNLFLTAAGTVKVLDFGIARLTSSRLTVAGNILGTPNYMAPEQILANACDGRADLFSAGVVFFELLVYKHPFRGPMIPQRIVEEEPDSLFDHQSNLPPILEKVFARALAKNPDDRYASAATFAADLRTVLASLRHPSPSLLPLDLPSSRTEAIISSIAAGDVEPAVAPAGEDSVEWRNSEVLMLIPQFEKAIEQKDQASAKRHYESLLRVTAGGGRFNEAIESCRVRLEQLGAQEPSAAFQTQRICMECGTRNRSAARFCIGCGANLDEVQPSSSVPTPIEPVSKPSLAEPGTGLSETVFERTAIYNPNSASATPAQENTGSEKPQSAGIEKPSGQAASPATWMRANRKYVVPAGVALLAVLIVTAGLLLRTSYAIEQAVATAVVSAAEMQVRQAETAASKSLYSLRRGESVNILKLPGSASQEWIKVQSVVGGIAKPAGFARQTDLSSLVGRDADSALAIIQVQHPDKPGEPAAPEKLNKLQALADQYPGTPAAMSALAEIAKARPPAPPTPPVQPPEDASAKLLEAQQLASERKLPEAEVALQELLAKQPENAEAQQLLKSILHSRRVKRLRYAEKLRLEEKYNEAERVVSSVIEEEPDNNAAKQLLQKIRLFRDARK